MLRKITLWLLLCGMAYALPSHAQYMYSYYYRGQLKSVTVSEKVMTVKFNAGTSNATRQTLIAAAQVDLLTGTLANIPEVVHLKSRILTRQRLHYPCGNPEVRSAGAPPSTQKEPPPCAGCPPPPPPNCTPYWVTEQYDNFYNALFWFADQPDVRSSSKAIITGTDKFVGTCEDFHIKIKPGYSIADFAALCTYYSLTAAAAPEHGPDVYKISESRGGSRWIAERTRIFFETGKCFYACPNIYELKGLATADPMWGEQWGMLNTGQHGGGTGADIRVEPAWNVSQGANIIVAVVDDGVQLDHPDLVNRLVPGFDARNGIAGGGPAMPEDNHGTACAGIIAANANNGVGISGVAPQAWIMPVRAFAEGRASSDFSARAITWAWQNAADVISCSWSSGIENDLLFEAVQRAVTEGRGGRGCVMVFAAGNNDETVVAFPARIPEVVAVGAITMCSRRVTASGNTCVGGEGWASGTGPELDVMAPGLKIATLSTNDGFRNDFGGTSSATAFVSGVAALVLSTNPNLTATEVRRILDLSANKTGAYCYNWTSAHPNGAWNNEMGYGRINANNAVQLALNANSYSPAVYDVPRQSNWEATGYMQQIFIGAPCSSLPSGVYAMIRHEVVTDIGFAGTNNPLILATSNGWSQANPNDGKRYAEAINITSTSARLRTFVYAGFNVLGQFLGWWPTAPSNIKFSYSIVGAGNPIAYQFFRNSSGTADAKIRYQFDVNKQHYDRPLAFAGRTEGLMLAPNPARNFVNMHINLENEQATSYTLFNTGGQLMKDVKWPVPVQEPVIEQFDVSGLKPGVYMLVVNTSRRRITQKLVVR